MQILNKISDIPRIVLTAQDHLTAAARKISIREFLAEKEREALVDKVLADWMKKDVNTGQTLDAYDRQLEVRGIRGSSQLGIFFTPENIGLFPELVESLIFNTENELDVNELKPADFIKTTIEIESNATKVTELSLPTGKKKAKRAVEGAALPQYSIQESGTTVTLTKYGFSVRITDEAKRRETVDSIKTVYNEIITNEIYRRQVGAGLAVLLAGGYTSFSLAGVNLTDLDLYRLMFSNSEDAGATVNQARRPDILITAADGATTPNGKFLFDLVSMRDSRTGYDITKPTLPPCKGRPVKFYHSPDGSGPDLDGKIVGLYTPLALRKYVERGSQITETARFINGQWNQMDWSIYIGFHRYNADCVRVLIP